MLQITARWRSWQSTRRNAHRISHLLRQVAEHARLAAYQRPVILFNATARLTGYSQNAAFAMLTSCGLRLAGVPLIHFVCRAGMSHCVLGTAWILNREQAATQGRLGVQTPMPCKACLAQSHQLYTGADVHWFSYQPDPALSAAIQDLSVDELSHFEFDWQSVIHNPKSEIDDPRSTIHNPQFTIPLGNLVLPSIRWAHRRHTLVDDGETRGLMRGFILSAYNVANEFAALIEKSGPSAALIFNGAMFPEATARWVARQLGVRAITHEVGFQRFSSFFTDGDATAYPIHIPDDFELNAEQSARLEAYLEKRFQGKFTMAGIRFWPEMRGLDEAFLQKAAEFRQIVPVFTNVIYDTSQVHANRIFPHMFAWLDLVLELIQTYPDTLFVIRAHPDEMRPGTRKQSRESVREWVLRNHVASLPNVVFIDSQEYISSYDLIQRARFVMVYNSSIGMEAALLGVPVLCGGKARYTQYPIVFSPESPQTYHTTAEAFLSADKIDVPADFQRNARRFLYYQLYRVSLSFEDQLQDSTRQGFVELRDFSWEKLLPDNSPAIKAVINGILGASKFELPE